MLRTQLTRTLSFWLLATAAVAITAAHAETAPDRVVVGVYVNQISGVDLKTNQFSVDFYIWFRWHNEKLKPLDSFELVNGRISAKTGIVRKTIDGESYGSCRVVATVTKFWDLRRFPLDSHVLTLEIEDSEKETDALLYVADTDNSGVDPSVQVPAWVVSRAWTAVTAHTDKTNHGDASLPQHHESTHARFISSTEIVRPGYTRFVKIFFGLLVSVLIGWLAFFVRPKDSSPRVILGVGALFAAAACTLAVTNSVPDSNVTTMAERMIILSFATIFATFMVTTVSLNLVYRGSEAAQRRMDQVCALLFPIVYVVLLLTWVF